MTARVDRTLLGAAAAVVGVADAVSPTGELDLHGRALEVAMVREALVDAGLELGDVDGVCHHSSSGRSPSTSGSIRVVTGASRNAANAPRSPSAIRSRKARVIEAWAFRCIKDSGRPSSERW